MRTIPLGKSGKIALIDDDDFELVSQYKWYAQKNWHTYYALSGTVTFRGFRCPMQMHRLIMCPSSDEFVDHIDSNGLNNQRANLRTCTPAGNSRHQRKWKKPTTSKFKGVCWHKRDRKWRAMIRLNGKKIWLGHYDDEVAAAHAYDIGAKKYHGEFALTNEDLGLY